jgi:hypothetical protein
MSIGVILKGITRSFGDVKFWNVLDMVGTNKSILLFQQYFFYNNNMLKFQ